MLSYLDNDRVLYVDKDYDSKDEIIGIESKSNGITVCMTCGAVGTSFVIYKDEIRNYRHGNYQFIINRVLFVCDPCMNLELTHLTNDQINKIDR